VLTLQLSFAPLAQTSSYATGHRPIVNSMKTSSAQQQSTVAPPSVNYVK